MSTTSYKFVFEPGNTIDLPMRYQTVNADGTRTPIDLDGKRFTVTFLARGATDPMLVLDTDEPANDYGSVAQIINADAGRWRILVPDAQVAVLPKVFGRWTIHFFDGGVPRELAEGPFSVK